MDHLPMPKFGPLAGLRVVFSGIEIADRLPGKCSEWGAEVIWIENVAQARHHSRSTRLPATLRRNLHALSLNIFKDEGREAFLKLMEIHRYLHRSPVKVRPLPVVALPMKYCGSTTRN